MTWTPTPEAVERQALERSDKDNGQAIEVLKLAVDFAKASQITDPRALADVAEMLWLWVNSGSATYTQWPKPGNAP